jgi:hypothetical protein
MFSLGQQLPSLQTTCETSVARIWAEYFFTCYSIASPYLDVVVNPDDNTDLQEALRKAADRYYYRQVRSIGTLCVRSLVEFLSVFDRVCLSGAVRLVVPDIFATARRYSP